jgi:hypothetical protein
MASTANRKMLSTPSPSASLLVSPLPSLWTAPPKPIVTQLHHLSDCCFSPMMTPSMVLPLLTPWATPLRPSLVRLGFPLIPLLALPVGSPSLSPLVTPPKTKAVLQQSVTVDRLTSTSSCVGNTR